MFVFVFIFPICVPFWITVLTTVCCPNEFICSFILYEGFGTFNVPQLKECRTWLTVVTRYFLLALALWKNSEGTCLRVCVKKATKHQRLSFQRCLLIGLKVMKHGARIMYDLSRSCWPVKKLVTELNGQEPLPVQMLIVQNLAVVVTCLWFSKLSAVFAMNF